MTHSGVFAQSIIEEIDSLNELAAVMRVKNLDSMDMVAKNAYELANEVGYVEGRVEAGRLIASRLILIGKPTEAVELLMGEKLNLDTIAHSRENAIIELTIGSAHGAAQNYKTGIPFLIDALSHFRQLEDSVYTKRTLNNLGVSYIRLDQFDDALKIFKELEQSEASLGIGIRTTLIINLIYCYYGLGDYDNAEKYITKFMALPKNEVDERGYGFAYFKQGEIFLKQGQVDDAIRMFNKSVEVFDKFKTEPNKMEVYNGLAKAYLINEQYSKAVNNIEKGLAIANKTGSLISKQLLLNTQYGILKEQQKYAEALTVFEEYKTIADSISISQQASELAGLIARYEFNIQRDSLLLIQQQNDFENQLVVSRQRTTIRITIGIIAVIIVLLGLIYRGYTLKIRSNKMLQEKNNEIKSQRDQLEETNKVKNKLFSIIGHDLRSPISSLNGLLYLVKNKMANQEDLESLLPKLIDNFDQTSTLLSNLLSWTTSQMEGYTLEFTEFDMKDVMQRVLDNAAHRIEDKNIVLSSEVNSVKVYGEENMIEIVCHNLLSNAIKFCDENDTIQVKVSIDEKVKICVCDSGVGMSQERVKLLLDENNFSSTDGTNDEKGSGLGLTICKDFLEKNGSKLHIESEEGKGSNFYFLLDKV